MEKAPSTSDKNASCRLINTGHHDNSECLLQTRGRENRMSRIVHHGQPNGHRYIHHGQPNGHRYIANGARANTSITPISTTLTQTYNPATSGPAATTAAATTAIPHSICNTTGASSALPKGARYSVIEAPSSTSNTIPINFSLTADSAVSNNFIGNHLLYYIKQKRVNYVHLTPSVTSDVDGNYVFSVLADNSWSSASPIIRGPSST